MYPHSFTLFVASFSFVWCAIAAQQQTASSWTDWTEWRSCSVTCGQGLKSRYRTCNLPSKIGGEWCEGNYRQTEACDTGTSCPINGDWSQWSEWTSCSVSCGEGTMHRQRSCNDPVPQNGGQHCSGQKKEIQSCFALKDCPRDGKWSSWGQWSPCSVSCGSGGIIQRYRSCNNPPPAADGRSCQGLPQSVKKCEAPIKCPVNGQWSEWTEWTECSATCSRGEQRRWRGCDQPPPQFGGEDCNRSEAGEMQVRSCMGQLLHCPVDGGWSDWGEWGKCFTSDCHSTQHPGYQMRERSCNAPLPSHNGTMCQGTFLQAGVCMHPRNCKVNGGWSEWSEWICLEFVARRQRKCDNPAPANGGKACKGSEIEFYGRNDDTYRDLCPDFITDDEELQNGSGSGMEKIIEKTT